MNLQTNPELELAFEYVRNTDKSLFLTGKAGSGKTTFLHQIKADGRQRLAVVAPTGVAAINAGGMTIHSLFQLPLGIHLPGVERNEQNRQRHFSRKKKRLIRNLDLLVIDEISMVRADMLDAVDETLRRLRDSRRPFGGVQLLMIGDLHQLPPVVKQEDWDLLSRAYDTPYFFDSRALGQTDYISIELKHIYRQSDPEFIALLNKVRVNRLDEESLRKLNSRFVAGFRPRGKEAYITLTATNRVAHDINAENLKQLATPSFVVQARVVGEFPESSYPTDCTLEFKVGAQVMFIKNDVQPERRYFNGKIGRITDVGEDVIVVRCPGDPTDIAVTPAEWQNVKYSLNEETKQIDEQIVGTFTQYPLKLAWAITIHKSQGLTFERAIVDAEAAFAHGQVYVALSRCKSFEGIVLRSRISGASVSTDPVVQAFSEEAHRLAPSESQLQQAKREFQKSLLQELFCFDSLESELNQLRSMYAGNEKTLPPLALEQTQSLAQRARMQLFDVTTKFAPQLVEYLGQDSLPETNEALQARIQKASTYFTEEITKLLQDANELTTVADNQAVAAALASQLQAVQLAFFVKRACFAACGAGFTTQNYSRAKANAEMDFAKSVAASSRTPLVVPKGVPHPTLYRQLLQWREQTAQQKGRAPVEVLPNPTLRELVTYLPTDKTQLREIRGIGKTRLRRYGEEINKMIQKYCAEPQSPSHPTTPPARPQPRTSETKRQSYELYRAGKSVEEIAAERHLARSTIEGHLSHFIGLGELDIYSLLDRETVADIQQFFLATPEASAAEAKSHFGEKYSYGELNMVHPTCPIPQSSKPVIPSTKPCCGPARTQHARCRSRCLTEPGAPRYDVNNGGIRLWAIWMWAT
jgi:DNA-binding CsgD family transcriptional regulator/RecA/RadA recombinase